MRTRKKKTTTRKKKTTIRKEKTTTRTKKTTTNRLTGIISVPGLPAISFGIYSASIATWSTFLGIPSRRIAGFDS